MSSHAAEMEIIPHTVEPHPVTGLYNGKLGIWVFLASEVMLFGGLFSALVLLKVGDPNWPHGHDLLNVPLGALNTVVLIFSSVSVVMAWANLKLGSLSKGRLWLGVTLLMSLIFLVIKGIEYGMKFHHGIAPSTSNFYGMYFTMTGLHGLHILGGVAVMAYLLGPGAKMWETERERYTNRVECAGLYWHFVDLVWIFLFPVLYLL